MKRIGIFLIILITLTTSSCVNSRSSLMQYEQNLEATIDNYYLVLQMLYLMAYSKANGYTSVDGISYDSLTVMLTKELDRIENRVYVLKQDADKIQKGMKQFYLHDYRDNFNRLKSQLINGEFDNAIEVTQKCLESIYCAKTFFHYEPKFYEEEGRTFL